MVKKIREIFEGLFHHDPDHCVHICKPHGHALIPERSSILHHINQYYSRKMETMKNISTFLNSTSPLSSPHDMHVSASDGPCSPYPSLNLDARECTQCNKVFNEIKACKNIFELHTGFDPLRQEVETLIKTHGRQKSTLMKIAKLDSVVKESLRLHGVGPCEPFR